MDHNYPFWYIEKMLSIVANYKQKEEEQMRQAKNQNMKMSYR